MSFITNDNSTFYGTVGTGGILNVTGNIGITGNLTVTGTITSPYTSIGVLKLPEYDNQSGNGANGYETIAFIDTNNQVRVTGGVGLQLCKMNGFPIYNTACILSLPANVTPLKLYNTPRNYYIIASDNKLYSQGYNGEGQLGSGNIGFTGSVCKVVFPETVQAITNFYTNNSQFINTLGMALTASGELYSWGYNEYGALGLTGITTIAGNTSTPTISISQSVPQFKLSPFNSLASPNNIVPTVTQVCCQGTNTDANGLYTDYCVSTAALVYTSTTAGITSGGTSYVYCTGYGMHGQMGQGDANNSPSAWVRVKTSPTVYLSNVIKIGGSGSGKYTSFYALNNSNDLYGWGANNTDEFGTGVAGSKSYATLIPPSPNGTGYKIKDFWSCSAAYGQSSLFVKDMSDTLYASGSNGWGQLGIGTIVPSIGFKKCIFSDGLSPIVKTIKTSGGGDGVSVFIITDSTTRSLPQLYGCGHNNQGGLGLGHTTAIVSFTPIPFYSSAGIKDIWASSVSFIGSFTLILTNDNKLYGMGLGTYSRFSPVDVTSNPYIKHLTNYIC